MNNTRFATRIHILALLALKKDEWVSSAFIASSIGVNAAVVRREMSVLTELGLVENREGRGGGCRLAKAPERIRLSVIYETASDGAVLGRLNDTNAECPVGRDMNAALERLIRRAEKALLGELRDVTLKSFCRQFAKPESV